MEYIYFANSLNNKEINFYFENVIVIVYTVDCTAKYPFLKFVMMRNNDMLQFKLYNNVTVNDILSNEYKYVYSYKYNGVSFNLHKYPIMFIELMNVTKLTETCQYVLTSEIINNGYSRYICEGVNINISNECRELFKKHLFIGLLHDKSNRPYMIPDVYYSKHNNIFGIIRHSYFSKSSYIYLFDMDVLSKEKNLIKYAVFVECDINNTNDECDYPCSILTDSQQLIVRDSKYFTLIDHVTQ